MAAATLATRGAAARRRPVRGGGCEEPPRLWGDDPPVPETRPASPGPTAQAVRSAAAPALVATPPAPVLGATLADRVADSWETLVSADECSCLLCGEAMVPRWSAGAGVVGGRCGGCGTTLE